MYTHYSPLETVLTTSPQPGFVLQTEPTLTTPFFADKNRNRQNQNQNYLSLIGGIVAHLHRHNADIHLPFYNPSHDVAVGGKDPKTEKDDAAAAAVDDIKINPASEISSIRFNQPSQSIMLPPPDLTDPLRLRKAIAQFRILSFAVRSPPTCVATYHARLSRPKDLLNSISLSLESAVQKQKLPTGNLHRLGSMEYSGHMLHDPKNRFGSGEGRGGVRRPILGYTASSPSLTKQQYGVSYPPARMEGVGLLDRVAEQGTKYKQRWDMVLKKDRGGAMRVGGVVSRNEDVKLGTNENVKPRKNENVKPGENEVVELDLMLEGIVDDDRNTR